MILAAITGFILYFNNPHTPPTVLHKHEFKTIEECSEVMNDLAETEMSQPFTEEDALRLRKSMDGPIIFNKNGSPRRLLIVKCL